MLAGHLCCPDTQELSNSTVPRGCLAPEWEAVSPCHSLSSGSLRSQRDRGLPATPLIQGWRTLLLKAEVNSPAVWTNAMLLLVPQLGTFPQVLLPSKGTRNMPQKMKIYCRNDSRSELWGPVELCVSGRRRGVTCQERLSSVVSQDHG